MPLPLGKGEGYDETGDLLAAGGPADSEPGGLLEGPVGADMPPTKTRPKSAGALGRKGARDAGPTKNNRPVSRSKPRSAEGGYELRQAHIRHKHFMDRSDSKRVPLKTQGLQLPRL